MILNNLGYVLGIAAKSAKQVGDIVVDELTSIPQGLKEGYKDGVDGTYKKLENEVTSFVKKVGGK